MVKTGLDHVFDTHRSLLAGKRLGLCGNQSSVNSKLEFIADLFLDSKDWKVVALFGPEHGLRGEVQDQVWSETFTDPRTGLPVYSLYGKRLKPDPEMLQDLDAIVFDIQDVGSRYYTFIYTLAYIMEACAEAGKEVIVLDRPNPINGSDVEGPVLSRGYESFVGRYPIPTRHGLTIGEFAGYLRSVEKINCKLQVVPVEGWKRDQYFDSTQLPWVLPSPNMPTLETAIVYPGMCLFEGTNVSEGRGTTRPFEIFGAPWIDPHEFCGSMADYELPGVTFRPHYFLPTFNKYQGQLCGGAEQHITDRSSYKPVLTAVCILSTLLKRYGAYFEWKQPPYEFETEKLPIDILFGNSWVRERLESGVDPKTIESSWQEDLNRYVEMRGSFLLY